LVGVFPWRSTSSKKHTDTNAVHSNVQIAVDRFVDNKGTYDIDDELYVSAQAIKEKELKFKKSTKEASTLIHLKPWV
jgi:hypothetical protein